MAIDPEFEWPGNRGHPDPGAAPAAGAWRKRGHEAQALGRARGGFGTKLHAVIDAPDLAVRFAIGPGQQNGMAPACGLVGGLARGQALADPYDADQLHDVIPEDGGDL